MDYMNNLKTDTINNNDNKYKLSINYIDKSNSNKEENINGTILSKNIKVNNYTLNSDIYNSNSNKIITNKKDVIGSDNFDTIIKNNNTNAIDSFKYNNSNSDNSSCNNNNNNKSNNKTDYDPILSLIKKLKKIDCIQNYYGYKNVVKDFYFCLNCDSEEKEPICKECAVNCHKGHASKLVVNMFANCSCGKSNHNVYDRTLQDFKNKETECLFTEWNKESKKYCLLKNKDLNNVCFYCFMFCNDDNKDDISNNNDNSLISFDKLTSGNTPLNNQLDSSKSTLKLYNVKDCDVLSIVNEENDIKSINDNTLINTKYTKKTNNEINNINSIDNNSKINKYLKFKNEKNSAKIITNMLYKDKCYKHNKVNNDILKLKKCECKCLTHQDSSEIIKKYCLYLDLESVFKLNYYLEEGFTPLQLLNTIIKSDVSFSNSFEEYLNIIKEIKDNINIKKFNHLNNSSMITLSKSLKCFNFFLDYMSSDLDVYSLLTNQQNVSSNLLKTKHVLITNITSNIVNKKNKIYNVNINNNNAYISNNIFNNLFNESFYWNFMKSPMQSNSNIIWQVIDNLTNIYYFFIFLKKYEYLPRFLIEDLLNINPVIRQTICNNYIELINLSNNSIDNLNNKYFSYYYEIFNIKNNVNFRIIDYSMKYNRSIVHNNIIKNDDNEYIKHFINELIQSADLMINSNGDISCICNVLNIYTKMFNTISSYNLIMYDHQLKFCILIDEIIFSFLNKISKNNISVINKYLDIILHIVKNIQEILVYFVVYLNDGVILEILSKHSSVSNIFVELIAYNSSKTIKEKSNYNSDINIIDFYHSSFTDNELVKFIHKCNINIINFLSDIKLSNITTEDNTEKYNNCLSLNCMLQTFILNSYEGYLNNFRTLLNNYNSLCLSCISVYIIEYTPIFSNSKKKKNNKFNSNVLLNNKSSILYNVVSKDITKDLDINITDTNTKINEINDVNNCKINTCITTNNNSNIKKSVHTNNSNQISHNNKLISNNSEIFYSTHYNKKDLFTNNTTLFQDKSFNICNEYNEYYQFYFRKYEEEYNLVDEDIFILNNIIKKKYFIYLLNKEQIFLKQLYYKYYNNLLSFEDMSLYVIYSISRILSFMSLDKTNNNNNNLFSNFNTMSFTLFMKEIDIDLNDLTCNNTKPNSVEDLFSIYFTSCIENNVPSEHYELREKVYRQFCLNKKSFNSFKTLMDNYFNFLNVIDIPEFKFYQAAINKSFYVSTLLNYFCIKHEYITFNYYKYSNKDVNVNVNVNVNDDNTNKSIIENNNNAYLDNTKHITENNNSNIFKFNNTISDFIKNKTINNSSPTKSKNNINNKKLDIINESKETTNTNCNNYNSTTNNINTTISNVENKILNFLSFYCANNVNNVLLIMQKETLLKKMIFVNSKEYHNFFSYMLYVIFNSRITLTNTQTIMNYLNKYVYYSSIENILNQIIIICKIPCYEEIEKLESIRSILKLIYAIYFQKQDLNDLFNIKERQDITAEFFNNKYFSSNYCLNTNNTNNLHLTQECINNIFIFNKLDKKIKLDLFITFIKLVNHVFDGNSLLNETQFLFKIMDLELIKKILRINNAEIFNVEYRSEILKFMRMTYIDIIIDSNKVKEYRSIIMNQNKLSNNYLLDSKYLQETASNNLIRDLLSVNRSLDNIGQEIQIIKEELLRFPYIYSHLSKNNKELFKVKDDYCKTYNNNELKSFYLENGILLPLYVLIKKFISIVHLLSGYAFIDLYEIAVFFLKIKIFLITGKIYNYRNLNYKIFSNYFMCINREKVNKEYCPYYYKNLIEDDDFQMDKHSKSNNSSIIKDRKKSFVKSQSNLSCEYINKNNIEVDNIAKYYNTSENKNIDIIKGELILKNQNNLNILNKVNKIINYKKLINKKTIKFKSSNNSIKKVVNPNNTKNSSVFDSLIINDEKSDININNINNNNIMFKDIEYNSNKSNSLLKHSFDSAKSSKHNKIKVINNLSLKHNKINSSVMIKNNISVFNINNNTNNVSSTNSKLKLDHSLINFNRKAKSNKQLNLLNINNKEKTNKISLLKLLFNKSFISKSKFKIKLLYLKNKTSVIKLKDNKKNNIKDSILPTLLVCDSELDIIKRDLNSLLDKSFPIMYPSKTYFILEKHLNSLIKSNKFNTSIDIFNKYQAPYSGLSQIKKQGIEDIATKYENKSFTGNNNYQNTINNPNNISYNIPINTNNYITETNKNSNDNCTENNNIYKKYTNQSNNEEVSTQHKSEDNLHFKSIFKILKDARTMCDLFNYKQINYYVNKYIINNIDNKLKQSKFSSNIKKLDIDYLLNNGKYNKDNKILNYTFENNINNTNLLLKKNKSSKYSLIKSYYSNIVSLVINELIEEEYENRVLNSIMIYENLKYKLSDSNFLENLAEKNFYCDTNYRQLFLKSLFFLATEENIPFKFNKESFWHLFKMLQNDTAKSQIEISNLYSEDSLNSKLVNLLNVFTMNSLSVVFASCNPCISTTNEDYYISLTVVKIFKYLCEEHNNFFQTLCFKQIEIKTDKNATNNTYLFKNTTNENKTKSIFFKSDTNEKFNINYDYIIESNDMNNNKNINKFFNTFDGKKNKNLKFNAKSIKENNNSINDNSNNNTNDLYKFRQSNKLISKTQKFTKCITKKYIDILENYKNKKAELLKESNNNLFEDNKGNKIRLFDFFLYILSGIVTISKWESIEDSLFNSNNTSINNNNKTFYSGKHYSNNNNNTINLSNNNLKIKKTNNYSSNNLKINLYDKDKYKNMSFKFKNKSNNNINDVISNVLKSSNQLAAINIDRNIETSYNNSDNNYNTNNIKNNKFNIRLNYTNTNIHNNIKKNNTNNNNNSNLSNTNNYTYNNNSSYCFYDLFSALIELIIEMVQGTTKSNLENILNSNENFGLLNKKLNCKNNLDLNTINTSTPFTYFLSCIKPLIFKPCINDISFKIRIDLMNFVLAFLEEKATPIKAVNQILYHFPAKMMYECMKNVAKQLYYKIKMLNNNFNNKDITNYVIDNNAFFDYNARDLLIKMYYREELSNYLEFEFANKIFVYLRLIKGEYENTEADSVFKIMYDYRKEDDLINQYKLKFNVCNNNNNNNIFNINNFFKTNNKSKTISLFNKENDFIIKNNNNEIELTEDLYEKYFIISFFNKITKTLFVEREGEINRVIFTICPKAYYISNSTKEDFLDNVDRSKRYTKLFSLTNSIDYFYEEAVYNYKNSTTSNSINILNSLNYKLLEKFIFLITFLINIFVVLGIKYLPISKINKLSLNNYINNSNTSNNDINNYSVNFTISSYTNFKEKEQHSVYIHNKFYYYSIFYLDYFVIIFNAFLLLAWILKKYPLYIRQRQNIYKKKNFKETIGLIDYITNIILKAFYYKFGELFPIIWNLVFGIVANLSQDYYYLFSIQLLIIYNLSVTLKTILLSIYIKGRLLLSILIFIFIFTNVFTYLAFYEFEQDFNMLVTLRNSETVSENYCTNMIECLLTSLNYGIRSDGGIHEHMNYAIYKKDNKHYVYRFFYDNLYFLILLLILLTLFFGIIIDTFGQLREFSFKLEEDKKNVCFICGINRGTLEKEGKTFEDHIDFNHNIWEYVAYMIGLKEVDIHETNSINSFVIECIEKKSIEWFPYYKKESE